MPGRHSASAFVASQGARRFDAAFFRLDTRFDYRLARLRFDLGILQWRLEVGIGARRGERLQDEIPVFSHARSSRR
jgi:hypothetical protein